MKLIDLTGQRYGRLTVIGRADKHDNGKTFWLCKCDCGNTCVVYGERLKRGKTISCGCYRKDISKKRMTIHGQRNTKLYSIYTNMLTRCYNEKYIEFNFYGGKGIRVCDEWKNSFENFYKWAKQNGYNNELSLDRINNNGNYEPSNCRWVTWKQQQRNKTNNIIYEYKGNKYCLAELTEMSNVKNTLTIKNRIKAGWDIDKVLNTPSRTYKGVKYE